jgi:hypothetical protein
MMTEFNFIDRTVSDKDIELFGFTDACNCFDIEDVWTMAHVMHIAGIFASVSIARKQGWNKPIAKGMSEFTVGKNKTKIWILGKMD